jgi:DNA (cytosine-5)-methyltransferase 1
VVVENVVGITKWDQFGAWVGAFRKQGYDMKCAYVNAADHGVPQDRKRVFIYGTLNTPAPFYKVPNVEMVPCGDALISRATLFQDWKRIDDAPRKAQVRMRRAQSKFDTAYVLSQHTTDHAGCPLDMPCNTITGQDQWVYVAGDKYRPLEISEYAALMGAPNFKTLEASRADNILGLGNMVCPPVARDILRMF